MDEIKYGELKAEGEAKIEQYRGKFFVIDSSQDNPVTSELTEDSVASRRQSCVDQIATLNSRISACDVMLADMASAPEATVVVA